MALWTSFLISNGTTKYVNMKISLSLSPAHSFGLCILTGHSDGTRGWLHCYDFVFNFYIKPCSIM